MTNLTNSPAWQALNEHFQEIFPLQMRDMFAEDSKRFDKLSLKFNDFLLDYSKQRISEKTMTLLINLARQCDIESWREKMFSGEKINFTENRAVLHTALRNRSNKPVLVDNKDVMPEVNRVLAQMRIFSDNVRSGKWLGYTGKRITDIVNIGIGGSDLGPAMAAKALSPFSQSGPRTHFVSNVDGADIADTLSGLDLAQTLFIVSSKTFTTQETMANAASARAYVVAQLGEAAVNKHFAAVSTRLDKVAEFGIDPSRIFGFWDWVGGRYSIWSSIGLALVIHIGVQNFTDFLQGAYDVDRHFLDAPLNKNIPVVMALLGVWNRNIMNRGAHAVIPYDQRLARFPAYLQQLDMESNGKSTSLSGTTVDYATGPVIFGEPGTNGQHAFFQLLHQGTDIVPIDFLIAAEPTAADRRHHDLLFANCLAQAEAFMRGRTLDEARSQLRSQGMSEFEIDILAPHKVFSGDRPSSLFIYQHLDPRTLGRLIALYEHKIFCQSVIWNINPFDQWGVELGKELANRLGPIAENKDASIKDLDASTAGLITWRRKFLDH